MSGVLHHIPVLAAQRKLFEVEAPELAVTETVEGKVGTIEVVAY